MRKSELQKDISIASPDWGFRSLSGFRRRPTGFGFFYAWDTTGMFGTSLEEMKPIHGWILKTTQAPCS